MAGHGAEDEAVIFPQVSELEPFRVLSRFVGLESLYGAPREPYAPSLAVLRRSESGTALGLRLGAPHAQDPSVEVHVFPPESQQFADSQTSGDSQHVEGLEAVAAASRREPGRGEDLSSFPCGAMSVSGEQDYVAQNT
jgi:hypothetical protein